MADKTSHVTYSHIDNLNALRLCDILLCSENGVCSSAYQAMLAMWKNDKLVLEMLGDVEATDSGFYFPEDYPGMVSLIKQGC